MYGKSNRAAGNQMEILTVQQGDVNGDGYADYVYLTGQKTTDSPYIRDITLMVRDGRTGQTIPTPLGSNQGYNPTLFLGDFTADGVKDVLVSINSGGSGGMMFHYIYSFIHNRAQLRFDYNAYNERLKYEVNYKDDYKVEVASLINKQRYIIDLSLKGADYLSEIYDGAGKLISPIEGFVNPLSGLYPVDYDSNHVFELLAYQKIAGRYNADTLGYVLNTLSWRGDLFGLANQNVAILGA